MDVYKLSKNVSIKDVDNAIRELDQLGKRWHDRLTLDNLRLSERYMQFELEVVVTFARVGVPKEYCAIFRRDDASTGAELGPDSIYDPEELNVADRRPGGKNCLVFVRDVNLIEREERAIPSLVWLQPADKALNFLAGTLYVSNKGLFKLFTRSADGEAIAANLPAVSEDGAADQMVEGGSKVVSTVPNEQAELARDILHDLDLENVVVTMRPCLSRDSIWFSANERIDHRIKISQVLFGPFDL